MGLIYFLIAIYINHNIIGEDGLIYVMTRIFLTNTLFLTIKALINLGFQDLILYIKLWWYQI
jgi:hypothetical protein